MTVAIYKEATKRTLPDLGLDKEQKVRILSEEIGLKLNLSHMVMGMTSELSELIACLGGTDPGLKVDKINLMEELGDTHWYLSNYCNLRDLPMVVSPVYDVEEYLCLDLLIFNIADLCDLVKRFVAYGDEIPRVRELECTYNIMVALHLFEKSYKLDGDAIRERNIRKLAVRYPDRFNDILAVNRDLEAERKVLENEKSNSQN